MEFKDSQAHMYLGNYCDFAAAYISPDTVMVQANGCVSYKAIPEDKPLEIIFMAPELQQKGIVDEKVGTSIFLSCIILLSETYVIMNSA